MDENERTSLVSRGLVPPTPVDSLLDSGVTRQRRHRSTCEANARTGTGTGTYNRPLDGHGQCDRMADHIDEDTE